MIVAATFATGLAIAVRAVTTDIREHRLPNRLVLALAVVGAVGLGGTLLATGSIPARLALGAVVFAGPLALANLASPASVGFGDVKFAAALGLYVSWFDPWAGAIALVAALIAAWPQSIIQVVRRTSSTVALGPYLLIGSAVAVALSAAR